MEATLLTLLGSVLVILGLERIKIYPARACFFIISAITCFVFSAKIILGN